MHLAKIKPLSPRLKFPQLLHVLLHIQGSGDKHQILFNETMPHIQGSGDEHQILFKETMPHIQGSGDEHQNLFKETMTQSTVCDNWFQLQPFDKKKPKPLAFTQSKF